MDNPDRSWRFLPIFVINLDEDTERLRRFARVTEFFEMTFVRWRATRGDELDHTRFNVRPLMPGVFIKDFTEWSRNEAACGVSHITLLQHITKHEIPWAVVLEDDAILRRTLPLDIADWHLPTDADIIMLSHRALTHDPATHGPQLTYGPVIGGAGTEGYLVSLDGARKLLRVLMPLRNPLDFQMYAHFRSVQAADVLGGAWRLPRNPETPDVELNAYRVIPNLVEHPGDTSTIGNGRHPRAHYFCKVLLGLDFKDEATSQEYRTYCHKVESPSIALAPYDGPVAPVARGTLYWRGVDVSHWDVGQPYFSASGPGPRHYRQDLFDVLLDAGVNVVRFNIFLDGLHHPFSLVHALAVADAAASRGLGLCAVLHLSDTWAYPSEQTKPLAWRDLALPELAQALRTYTHEVVAQLCSQGTPPAIVQVGNEITNGMVWPHPSEGTAVGGKLRAGDPGSWGNFTQLLRAGIDGVREAAADADKQPEVMLHFDNGGDTAAASSWFTQLDRHGVDYDIVGVSIHDHWSPGGKLEAVAGLRAIPPALPGKQIVVAETSHPYRPADRFPATPADSDPDHTPEGQAEYLRSALKLLRDNPNGTGLFWWGSVFFNDTVEHCPDFLRARALFVPDGSALPALRRFRL